MRRLLLLRHAKSDWDAGTDDHARPLNGRGRRSAEAMGELLARIDEVPDLALSSTAVRAASTVDLAAAVGGWNTSIEYRSGLYLTSAAGALAEASNAPDVVERLMLVGHQPTWSDLVERLTGGRVEVKTATVVGMDLPIASWSTVGAARGTIAYVLQPRHFLD